MGQMGQMGPQQAAAWRLPDRFAATAQADSPRRTARTKRRFGHAACAATGSLAIKDIAAAQAFNEKPGFSVMAGDQASHWLILEQGTTPIGLFHALFDKNVLTFNPGWGADAKEVNPFDDIRLLPQRLRAAGVPLDRRLPRSTASATSLAAGRRT
jgi:lactoylglutathione lyase